MPSSFKGVYPRLQKGRWFFTVWVALPKETKEVIQENLRALVPYCEWVSTLANNPSQDIPHISLRYLGFSDELDHDEVKKGKALFEQALEKVDDFEIEVGNMKLWTREVEGKVTVARINWEILKKDAFSKIHEALLEVPGYYLFESLEQDYYSPHISLGSVDMSKYSNYEFVSDYLSSKEFKTCKFKLRDFALNLTSPEKTEVVPLDIRESR